MRAVAFLLLALPACTLYTGADDDDSLIFPDAGGWAIDAPFMADAGPGGCAQWLPCPAAMPGRMTMCGRVLDAESDTRIDVGAVGGLCDTSSASGACHLWLRFFDATSFAQSASTPLVPATLRYDDCGRFIAANLPIPPSGYLGVVTDDAPGTFDDHAPTITATRVFSGQVIPQQLVYRLDRSVDAAWSAEAGLGAQTFADRGAVLALFSRYDGVAATGVQVTVGGTVDPASDYYFDSLDRSNVSTTLTATGANGAALRLGGNLDNHGGVGGEPPGCGWGTELAASVAGVLWVLPVPPFCPI